MKKCVLVVLLAVAVTAQADLVPNGDFQTIVKPGTLMPATINDGDYFNINSQTMHAGGIATYADGTTGSGIELPGWVLGAGSNTNADCMQGGAWGGPTGSGDIAALSFAGWGGPTYIETAAPLAVPALGVSEVLSLSCEVYNNGGPVVLELLADGVLVAPTTSSDPALIASDWVTLARTYSSVPAGVLSVLVGTRDDAGTGWTGNRVSIDNVALSVIPEPATMALLGLGGLALIRRRR